MMLATIAHFLPDSIFVWIALGIGAILVVALWVVPLLEMTWRLVGTFAITTIIIVGLLYSAWQTAEARADASEVLRQEASARAVAAENRERVLLREAAVRDSDTKARTEETARVTQSLDRIEGKVKRNEPVESNAAATAIVCSRLRRAGETGSAQYRRKCG
jgi:membrane protein implicated in regulation of membrane protease activity